MQLSILISILQSRVRYVAQSCVVGQVQQQQQQQQQINSVRHNYNTAKAVCVYCVVGGIADYDVIYNSTYRRGIITSQVL